MLVCGGHGNCNGGGDGSGGGSFGVVVGEWGGRGCRRGGGLQKLSKNFFISTVTDSQNSFSSFV